MTQCLAFLLQFFLNTLAKICLAQLIKLEPHEVLVLCIALNVTLHLFQAFLCLCIFAKSALVFCKSLVVFCYNVHHAELEILFAQHQVLVLTMYVEQCLSQLFYGCERHRSVVDERTTLACSSQFTPQDAVFAIVVDVVFLEERQ